MQAEVRTRYIHQAQQTAFCSQRSFSAIVKGKFRYGDRSEDIANSASIVRYFVLLPCRAIERIRHRLNFAPDVVPARTQVRRSE